MKMLRPLAALSIVFASAVARGDTGVWADGNPNADWGQCPGYNLDWLVPPENVEVAYSSGKNGGFKYDGSKEGRTVESLRVWVNDWYIIGVDIRFRGDTVAKRLGGKASTQGKRGFDDKFGSLSYNLSGDKSGGAVKSQEFTFKPGERVTNFALYTSCDNVGMGGLDFTTDQERSFKIKASFSWTESEHRREVSDVGSGLLAGFNSISDLTVYQLFPLFYRPIISAAKTLDIDQAALDANGVVEQTTLQSATKVNSTNSDSTFTWNQEVSEEFTSSWSVTYGLEVSVETEVKAGFSILAEGKLKVGAKVSLGGSNSGSTTTRKTISISDTFTARPGETVVFRAIATKGTCKSVPYTGTVTATFSGGATLTYPISGTYDSVTYSDVSVTATVTPSKQ